MRWILLLFVVVPLLELYLLLWLGSIIGFWPTVAITLVTGILGGTLAKREGLKVWREWRSALDQLRPPEQGVIDGVLVLIGGVLLVTPGILTDATGVVLLLPPTRRRIAARIRSGIDRRIADGRIHVASATFVDVAGIPRQGGPPARGPRADGVIETTGEDVEVEPPLPSPPARRG